MRSSGYMDEKEVRQTLIEILSAVLNEEAAYGIAPEILMSVYRLAKEQDLAHVVSTFVLCSQMEIDPELDAGFQREEYHSVCRHEQMKYTLEEICGIFDAAGIAYIPLKGAVLRPYYPCESMRLSCDIDILIREADLNLAIEKLEARGYQCGERDFHDVLLYSPNKIQLELHFSVREGIERLDAVLNDAWQYAVPSAGSRHTFRKEFFVFHMYAHMAYHFLSGGCGVRSLLDIWIMEHKMNVSCSCAEILLKKAGIYQFAIEMSKIANQCFTEKASDAASDPVVEYICRGGTFGSPENNIALYKTKTDSSTAYLIERLFMPYRLMVRLYPVLKKAPYLLPLFWVVRWVTAVFSGKTKKIAAEMISANSIPDQKVAEMKEICTRLGFYH